MDFPPEESNLFSAPQSVIGSRVSEVDFETDAEAETTRLYQLSHESSIKSVGLLGYFVGMLCMIFTTFGVLAGLGILEGRGQGPGTSPESLRPVMWLGAAVWGVPCALGFALGIGLRRLQVWARWAAMVVLALTLLYSFVVGFFMMFFIPGPNLLPVILVMLAMIAIQAYLFYLLVIPKSGMVFSPEYRLVIQKTPGIICKSRLIAKLLIGLGVAILVLFFIGGMATTYR